MSVSTPGRKSTRPSDGELEILRVLWEQGPGTARQVYLKLKPIKQTTYNTTLKLMLIMHDKGLLDRNDTVRPQVYSPAMPAEQMQRKLVSDFVQRVFGGSARKLVAAMTETDISREELKEIRQLLGELKGK